MLRWDWYARLFLPCSQVSLLEMEAANLRKTVEEVRIDLKSKESTLEVTSLNFSVLESELKVPGLWFQFRRQ